MTIAASVAQARGARPDGPIRVLVVDDSVVIRGFISRWIAEQQDMIVAGSAANGRIAVGLAAKTPFDVAILDIEMPEMDGLAALPLLLKAQPNLKILMASTLTRRNADISIKALSLGATDYVPKPESMREGRSPDEFRADLIEKVRALGARRGTRAPLARPTAKGPVATSGSLQEITLRPASTTRPQILAIGSSTGGPQALFELTRGIASSIDVPIVITQHMPATFTSILAEHIGKICGLPTREGENGEPLRPRQIYIAPGGRHMILTRRDGHVQIALTDGPAENFCKPAVDPLFRSVADIYGATALCAVLTGMGADGREGARKVAAAGGTILVQDEASSVVWGMPGAVAQAGLASAVLPLAGLPREILKLMGRAR